MKMNMKLPFSLKPSFDRIRKHVQEWIESTDLRVFRYRLSLQKMGLIIGCYLLFIVPFVFLFIYATDRIDHLDRLKESANRLPIRMERVKHIQNERSAVTYQQEEIDHYYIDHVLEPMTFLKPEVEALKLVYGHSAFESCDNVKKRLEILTQGSNQLIFSEGSREIKDGIEEVEFNQGRPVEINTTDLKTILTAIEGIPLEDMAPLKGRPQLVIRSFHLNKETFAERETYLLTMQLIRRGILK